MLRKNLKTKTLALATAIAAFIGCNPITTFCADDTTLNNDIPASNQETNINLSIVSEATVSIPKNISFNINADTNSATFNETTNCYEYYVTVSAAGDVMSAESVFIGLDESTVIFVDKDNPSNYFCGDIFYHNVENDSSYDATNLEESWSKDLLANEDSAVREKTLVITVPAEVVVASGNYSASVNFGFSKGVESSAFGNWATTFSYKLVGNGDAVITGYAENVTQEMIDSYETLVIPKKIKTASGVMAKVVGVEAGAFKNNTQIKTLKVSADCALSVVTSAGDGDISIYNSTSPNYIVGSLTSWNNNGSAYRGLNGYKQGFKSTISDAGTTYIWRDTVYPAATRYNAEGSFVGCTNLSKVYLIGNIEMIGRNTFKNCTKLSTIEIPASCKWVGAGAFIGCPNLNITAKGNTTKYPTFVEYIATKWGDAATISVAYVHPYSEAEANTTTNILNSALTGIVFDSGVSKKCTA